MVVMFMKNFPDGKPTEFLSKIMQGFFNVPGEFAPRQKAKFHTIRQSKRIKAGMRLSFRNWSGRPYNSKQIEFAETECASTQDIEIKVWTDDGGFECYGVKVDGRQLLPSEVERLAVNDGFESLDDFIKYFKKGFCGQIIHWTSLKY